MDHGEMAPWACLPASTPVWACGSRLPTISAFPRSNCTRRTRRRGRRSRPSSSSRGSRIWESASRSCSAVSRARATPTSRRLREPWGWCRRPRVPRGWSEMKEISDFARLLGVEAVGLHVGFVPHDAADPLHREVVAVTRDLCDHCRANEQNLHLETGQETADVLIEFLGEVGRDNLFVNFDPANMILYGCGEPIAALRKVGRWVRSVHCKDAKWSARPGAGLGRRDAVRRGRSRHGDLPPHACRSRLRRPFDHRARDTPGARLGRRKRSAAASACSTN